MNVQRISNYEKSPLFSLSLSLSDSRTEQNFYVLSVFGVHVWRVRSRQQTHHHTFCVACRVCVFAQNFNFFHAVHSSECDMRKVFWLNGFHGSRLQCRLLMVVRYCSSLWLGNIDFLFISFTNCHASA